MYNLFVKSNKKRAKRRGFTLIELVIVIVILGVLAGVAALSFANVTGSAKDGVAKSNLRAAKSACQVFQVDHNGNLPKTKAGIEPYLDDELKTAWNNGVPGYTYNLTVNTSPSGITLNVKGGGLGTAGYSITISGPVEP